MIRLGILPSGVYPSASCRRLPGLAPVMSVKARFTTLRDLAAGEYYGYGLRYRAPSPQRIGVLPIGYADGYPRLRNQGHILVRGQRAPLIGGVAMDAIGVNLTHLPEVRLGDVAVLMGRQGSEEISARELAEWGGTVCYDILAGWRARLPRRRIGTGAEGQSVGAGATHTAES
jgi:alanine racemase